MINITPSQFTILIVDDVDTNQLLVESILSTEGYQTLKASSGHEALEQMKLRTPDLILMDVMMPNMDGFETTELIRQEEEWRELPIIFLTALNSSDDIIKGFNSGGADFITKPFNRYELLIRVRYQISLIEAKRTIRRQNEELTQSMNARDRLYSVIAHDLRGPLGSIIMALNYLSSHITDEQVGSDQLKILTNANKTAEETFLLLDNLLKWTKTILGRLNVVYQNIDLSNAILGVINIFAPIAASKRITIENLTPPEMIVRGDADMIKTVLRNLLNNAIKFSYPDSKIRINVVSDALETTFSIADFGKGIALEDQEKLFRPDIQHSTFGTHNEEGSGLGLQLCYEFIQKNQGKIGFTSIPDQGSTFYFSLPKVDTH